MRRVRTLLASVLAIFAPFVAWAQSNTTGFTPLANVQNVPRLNNLYSSTNGLAGYVNDIFMFAISFGGIVAVLQFVRAGYLYEWSDSFGNKQKAKEIISNVVIGGLLLLSIWLILDVINPCILNLNVLQNLGHSQCPNTGN